VTETRGFPELKPVDAPPELERFTAAVRRLQDLAVSTNPDGDTWSAVTETIENACAALESHQVPDGQAPPDAPSSCRSGSPPDPAVDDHLVRRRTG
jgi:hypothetical protein